MMNNKGNERNDSGLQLQLPIGYRFRPTDEELILHYLKPKLLSFPFPSSVIPHHLHLFHSHPSLFLGDCKEKKYFFCKRSWNHFKKCRLSTTDGSGYWKALKKDKYICSTTGSIIGTKKSLVFYQGIHPHSIKTQWVMKEFSLLPSQTATLLNQKMEDWVIFCIYQRRRSKKHQVNKTRKNEDDVIAAQCENLMDFIILDSTESGPPLPSPSCSSGISEHVPSDHASTDQEETCSGSNTIPVSSYW
ncbi:NAC domain-containing protein [Heracleum sosnowskyi]|uniref:NAC domain-containing protein n=1 Tax=Heracleum sosnowskyi TaxID=360622 RepID=A0AAD8H514_9APIA|nr:NAC domain-containing protein [Heracleum sosnowskyi]